VKVALYARVSKSDESQDPENQLMRLRSYASERGWEVFEEYVDMASGADANRPRLRRMLNDANARRLGLVLTTKIDRIARSSLDLKLLISELEGRGIKFECTDQPFSTNTPTGKLLFGILGEIAEFERALIVERTKAGLARARAQGKRLGHPRLEVGWKGHPRVDFARVHALRAQGMSYRVIAKQLGVSHQTVKNRLRNEGAPSPKGNETSSGGIRNGR
jgi:DNA invertase Pin-like site-specific DNA recombinase